MVIYPAFWFNSNTERTNYPSVARIIGPKEVSHAQGVSWLTRRLVSKPTKWASRFGLYLLVPGRAAAIERRMDQAAQTPLRVRKRPELTARMLFGRAVKFVPL